MPRARDPLAPGLLRCAYCTEDYLAWLRDPEGQPAPDVSVALTVLPSGGAVCLAHMKALARTRDALERHRTRRPAPTAGRPPLGVQPQPMPRAVPA